MTLTTTPLIVAPHSIPRIGIYVSGAQNFSCSIANRLPRSETGMVDPPIASKTAGNCQNTPSHTVAPGDAVRSRASRESASAPCSTLEMGSALTMPENLRFDLLTVCKMRCVNRVSHTITTCTPSCGATVSICPRSEREGDPIPQGIERFEPSPCGPVVITAGLHRLGSERRDSGAGRWTWHLSWHLSCA